MKDSLGDPGLGSPDHENDGWNGMGSVQRKTKIRRKRIRDLLGDQGLGSPDHKNAGWNGMGYV